MDKFFNTLLKLCLVAFLISGIIGFFFLSTNQIVYAITCAKIGGLASIAFTAIVIGEVIASENAPISTKVAWVISFLLFQIFAGLAYYFADRKSIYPSYILQT